MGLSLELGDPRPSLRCPDCGEEQEVVSGLIYGDGQPYAAYDGIYCRSHRDRGASLRIVVADWSQPGLSPSWPGFGIEVRGTGREYEFMLVGPDRLAGGANPVGGPVLSREEALMYPNKENVFRITEHIIHEDARLLEFFVDDP